MNNKSNPRSLNLPALITLAALFYTLLAVSGCRDKNTVTTSGEKNVRRSISRHTSVTPGSSSAVISEAKAMPVYGNWKHYTTENGLPSDKVYTVRIDGKRVLAGTHDGLAVYDKGKWTTYTKEDGLAHNGVASIDVSDLTGDVWIGTLGGLTRWSAGKFETFNQFNSGMPNDLVYCVFCDGKDVWVATGGGAGKYDTFTRQWEIFTEANAPMHEPWATRD